MKLIEFRIFMPMKLEMFSIATKYTAGRRMREYTGGGDGFEIVETRNTVENGHSEQFVHSIIHFKNQIPYAFRWIVPDKYAHVHTYNHISFPLFEGDFTIPAMGDDFILHTKTNHIEYIKGEQIPDNLNNWKEEEMKERQIIYLDILDGPLFNMNDLDLHGYSCKEIEMSQLQSSNEPANDNEIPSWISFYEKDITLVVITVKCKFEWYGLQTLVEKGIINVWYQVYMNMYRAMLKWAPEWCNLSEDQINELVDKTKDKLNENKFDI